MSSDCSAADGIMFNSILHSCRFEYEKTELFSVFLLSFYFKRKTIKSTKLNPTQPLV